MIDVGEGFRLLAIDSERRRDGDEYERDGVRWEQCSDVRLGQMVVPQDHPVRRKIRPVEGHPGLRWSDMGEDVSRPDAWFINSSGRAELGPHDHRGILNSADDPVSVDRLYGWAFPIEGYTEAPKLPPAPEGYRWAVEGEEGCEWTGSGRITKASSSTGSFTCRSTGPKIDSRGDPFGCVVPLDPPALEPHSAKREERVTAFGAKSGVTLTINASCKPLGSDDKRSLIDIIASHVGGPRILDQREMGAPSAVAAVEGIGVSATTVEVGLDEPTGEEFAQWGAREELGWPE